MYVHTCIQVRDFQQLCRCGVSPHVYTSRPRFPSIDWQISAIYGCVPLHSCWPHWCAFWLNLLLFGNFWRIANFFVRWLTNRAMLFARVRLCAAQVTSYCVFFVSYLIFFQSYGSIFSSVWGKGFADLETRNLYLQILVLAASVYLRADW